MRVPVIVISPFTKRGYVSHRTYDDTSITRFIETKFKLPALTSRDANAEAANAIASARDGCCFNRNNLFKSDR